MNKFINFFKRKTNDTMEREVKITLEKAREWYNGNSPELKAVALQAFTEDELNSYPETWIDYAKQNSDLPAIVSELPIEDLCYCKVRRLRKAWIKNWTPTWQTVEWCIVWDPNKYRSQVMQCSLPRPLSFPTEKMAKEFLSRFNMYLILAYNCK